MNQALKQVLGIAAAAAFVFATRAVPRLMFREQAKAHAGPAIDMPVAPAVVVGGTDFIDRAAELPKVERKPMSPELQKLLNRTPTSSPSAPR